MEWKVATLIESSFVSDDVKSLRFAVENWTPHKAGQHYDLRLTAEDGYQAQRSYSIASSPFERGVVEFGVQLLPEGEVSSYLGIMKPGEQIEIRGPIGGYFVWEESQTHPLLLIAGGSGVVPFLSILRTYQQVEAKQSIGLFVSAKRMSALPYSSELMELQRSIPSLETAFTFTQETPDGWEGFSGRVRPEMINRSFGPLLGQAVCYVCGPTAFVEEVSQQLVGLGQSIETIKTERFG